MKLFFIQRMVSLIIIFFCVKLLNAEEFQCTERHLNTEKLLLKNNRVRLRSLVIRGPLSLDEKSQVSSQKQRRELRCLSFLYDVDLKNEDFDGIDLEKLNITHCLLNQSNIQGLIKLNNLRSLALDGCKLNGEIILTIVDSLSGLISLSIKNNQLTDDDINPISEKRPNLRELKVSDPDIHLENVPLPTNIELLECVFCPVASTRILLICYRYRKLRELYTSSALAMQQIKQIEHIAKIKYQSGSGALIHYFRKENYYASKI